MVVTEPLESAKGEANAVQKHGLLLACCRLQSSKELLKTY